MRVVKFWFAFSFLICCLLEQQQQYAVAEKTIPPAESFPSLSDTFEMATLSVLMYHFHRESDDETVCENINLRNFTLHDYTDHSIDPSMPHDIVCHYYYHERNITGTQVLVASSTKFNYVALVWAGTDDLRTSLTDAKLVTVPFGEDYEYTNHSCSSSSSSSDSTPYRLPDERIRVHAGFNEYVFGKRNTNHGNNEQEQQHTRFFPALVERFEAVRAARPQARIFTTGHSLGASSSILSAVALALYYNNNHRMDTATTTIGDNIPTITSISFGCPQMGNSHWQAFINQPEHLPNVRLWRFVLGWDLVPRLPKLFYHAGHTVQLTAAKEARKPPSSNASTTTTTTPQTILANGTARAYYQHHGNATLGLAGVPFGWSALPFVWLPGALYSHAAHRYWEHLHGWWKQQQQQRRRKRQRQLRRTPKQTPQSFAWMHDFERVPNHTHHDDDDDDDRPIVNVDDDFYVDPPDDDSYRATATT